MSEQDRIAEIEDLSVKEFKQEIQDVLESLKSGAKPGNTIELLAAALHIGHMGENLKAALETWLQLDMWDREHESKKR